MYVIEMVSYNIKPDVNDILFLQLSSDFETSLKREISGFIRRSVTKSFNERKCIELIWWKSIKDATIALEKMPLTNEFKKFCEILEDENSEIIYLKEMKSIIL